VLDVAARGFERLSLLIGLIRYLIDAVGHRIDCVLHILLGRATAA
jgi:hypothetical protein